MVTSRRRITLVVLASLCALALGASGTASDRTAGATRDTLEGPALRVEATDDDYPLLDLLLIASEAGAPGRLTLYVPKGFELYPDRPPGRPVAQAFVFAADSAYGSTAVSLLTGEVAGAQLDAAAEAAAQACSPGTHVALWQLQLSLLGQPIQIPIYLSAVGPDDPPDAGLKLELCAPTLPGSEPGSGPRLPILALRLFMSDFGLPRARGNYLWHALVTPLAPDQKTLIREKIYELRADTPIPHRITLDGRYDAKRRQAVLYGRLTAAGRARPGTRVWISGLIRKVTPSGIRYQDYLAGSTKTTAQGAYTFRTRLRRTTGFLAHVEPVSGRCPDALAPAGCLSTTMSGVTSDPITLSVPRRGR